MAVLEQRNGYWSLRWKEKSGVRRRVSLGKVSVVPARVAKDILKAKELELSSSGQLLNLGFQSSVLFKTYADDYLYWHQHEYPASHYRVLQIVNDHLLPKFGNTPLDLILPKTVEQYKIERNAKSQTIIKELRTLKAILNRAVREGIISHNPIAYVNPPQALDSKPHRFYEAEELTSIYAAVIAPLHAPMWKLFVNTGMRRMEGLNLKRAWVGQDGLKVISSEASRTKSGKWREIPLSEGAKAALEELPKDEFVLPRINPVSVSRGFEHDARRAGLDGSLHTLRHTYISHLVRSGVPLRTVQIYAGHASYSTTEKYAYLSPGSTHDAVKNLSL